jgi:hypothetical protein
MTMEIRDIDMKPTGDVDRKIVEHNGLYYEGVALGGARVLPTPKPESYIEDEFTDLISLEDPFATQNGVRLPENWAGRFHRKLEGVVFELLGIAERRLSILPGSPWTKLTIAMSSVAVVLMLGAGVAFASFADASEAPVEDPQHVALMQQSAMTWALAQGQGSTPSGTTMQFSDEVAIAVAEGAPAASVTASDGDEREIRNARRSRRASRARARRMRRARGH